MNVLFKSSVREPSIVTIFVLLSNVRNSLSALLKLVVLTHSFRLSSEYKFQDSYSPAIASS